MEILELRWISELNLHDNRIRSTEYCLFSFSSFSPFVGCPCSILHHFLSSVSSHIDSYGFVCRSEIERGKNGRTVTLRETSGIEKLENLENLKFKCCIGGKTRGVSTKNEQGPRRIKTNNVNSRLYKKKRENSIYFLTQAKMFTRRIYSG